jgi:integrase
MRKDEVLDLRRSKLDMKAGCIRLKAEDTKTDEPRTVYLTQRTLAALRGLPTHLETDFVFVNPETKRRWVDIRSMWERACKRAGIEGLWIHDLRRSFVSNATSRGVPAKVVMRMSGHTTEAVFRRYNIATDEDMKAAIGRIEQGAERELGQKTTEEGKVDVKEARAQLGQDLDTLYSESVRKKKGLTGKSP